MAAREKGPGNSNRQHPSSKSCRVGSQQISSGEREQRIRDDRVRCGLYWVTTTDFFLNGSYSHVVQPRTSEPERWLGLTPLLYRPGLDCSERERGFFRGRRV
jgi:hypothetical protein